MLVELRNATTAVRFALGQHKPRWKMKNVDVAYDGWFALHFTIDDERYEIKRFDSEREMFHWLSFEANILFILYKVIETVEGSICLVQRI